MNETTQTHNSDQGSDWNTPDFWNDTYQQNADHAMVANPMLLGDVADLSPGDVVDLGCGVGTHLFDLAAKGWRITGVDWAPHAIATAQARAKEHDYSAEFHVGDISKWRPADDRQFDLVLSSFALPLSPEGVRALLANASALVKPGGHLLLYEWDESMEEKWRAWDEAETAASKGDALQQAATSDNKEALPSMQDLVNALPDLKMERTVVACLAIEDFFPDAKDPRRRLEGVTVNVALVRAIKPADKT